MHVEPFRSTREVILTGPGGVTIRIIKYTPKDGKNLGGHIGIELPPGWGLSSTRRVKP